MTTLIDDIVDPEHNPLGFLQNIVYKNLKFQHYWNDLTCLNIGDKHTILDLSPQQDENRAREGQSIVLADTPLSRPIIIGSPPEPLYMLDPLLSAETKDGHDVCPKEIVIPSSLNESWSMKDWADIFDGLPDIKDADKSESRKKRALLAVVAGDSTVVYYLVHAGVVKPRQN